MNELQRQVLRNRQIRVEITQTFEAVPDNRYRCLVTLMRSDRPQVWTFLCPRCGSKVCELLNSNVYAIDDFYDPQALSNTGIGRHCKGQLPNGGQCPYTYFFNLQ